MGSVTTVTINGTVFSIYGSEADADDYFDGSVSGNTAWAGFATVDKERALVSATRILEKVAWDGLRTDVTTPQPLAWPRSGIIFDGITIADTTVPDQICSATFEIALLLAQNNFAVQNNSSSLSQVKLSTVGPITTEFFTPEVVGLLEGRFPTNIQELIAPFLGSAGIALACNSGADGTSLFTDAEQWDILLYGLP